MTDSDELLRQAPEAYEGKYKAEIQALLGLSTAEITRIRRHPTDPEFLEALIAVVMEASRQNLSEEALKVRIEKLGQEGIQIAKLVPGLARLQKPRQRNPSARAGVNAASFFLGAQGACPRGF
ncbi:MAG: hypothetical protein PVG99_09450 [Desulfobacteraceae bacterium]|jgi:hypothetical protein